MKNKYIAYNYKYIILHSTFENYYIFKKRGKKLSKEAFRSKLIYNE